VRKPERVTIDRRQRSKSPGELSAAWSVDALQEPPVPNRWEYQVLSVREVRWPPVTGAYHTHDQVLVDDDHRWCEMIGSVAVCLAAQKGIGSQIGVKCSLELVGQITGGDLRDDLATLVGDARVPHPPTQALLVGSTGHLVLRGP